MFTDKDHLAIYTDPMVHFREKYGPNIELLNERAGMHIREVEEYAEKETERSVRRHSAYRKSLWHTVAAIVLVWAMWQTYGIWRDALREPPNINTVETEGDHKWIINGNEYTADHATSTSPNYGSVSVTGYDRAGNVIWAVQNVNELRRVR